MVTGDAEGQRLVASCGGQETARAAETEGRPYVTPFLRVTMGSATLTTGPDRMVREIPHPPDESCVLVPVRWTQTNEAGQLLRSIDFLVVGRFCHRDRADIWDDPMAGA